MECVSRMQIIFFWQVTYIKICKENKLLLVYKGPLSHVRTINFKISCREVTSHAANVIIVLFFFTCEKCAPSVSIRNSAMRIYQKRNGHDVTAQLI